MGSGLERAYSKKVFFYYYWLQCQQVEISETSWSLYGMKPRSYNSAKFLNFSERRDPWGIWTLLRLRLNNSFFYFLLHLIKTTKNVRITYAQNHFKSIFGSAYLNSKKIKLKLAKQVKKEPRKAIFPWDLGLVFVHPMKYAFISGFNLF